MGRQPRTNPAAPQGVVPPNGLVNTYEGGPVWSQGVVGSPLIGGIPQQNRPVLGATGMPRVTEEMQRQAAYIPPPPVAPQMNLMALMNRLNQGSTFGRGGERGSGGYTTSASGMRSSAGYGGGMGGRKK